MEENELYGYGRALSSRRAALYPLSSLEVFMSIPLPDGEIGYRLLGDVKDETEFAEIMTHLPSECSSVHVYLYTRGEVVGNAHYGLDRKVVGTNPEQLNYINVMEFGLCRGLWHLFSEHYPYFDIVDHLSSR